MIAAEAWAILAEAVFYAVVIRGLRPGRALLVAAVANVASFAVGRLVTPLGQRCSDEAFDHRRRVRRPPRERLPGVGDADTIGGAATTPAGPSTTQGASPRHRARGDPGRPEGVRRIGSRPGARARTSLGLRRPTRGRACPRPALRRAATTAQTWDPTTNAWRPTEGLNKSRTQYVALPLADGRALVTGGENEHEVSFSSTYVFDPSTEKWSKSGLLAAARTSPSGATLKDGRVLVTGGYFDNGGPTGGSQPDAVLAAFHGWWHL